MDFTLQIGDREYKIQINCVFTGLVPNLEYKAQYVDKVAARFQRIMDQMVSESGNLIKRGPVSIMGTPLDLLEGEYVPKHQLVKLDPDEVRAKLDYWRNPTRWSQPQFRVEVRSSAPVDSDAMRSFVFTGSVLDAQKPVYSAMDEETKGFALYCFFSDAYAGNQTHKDFCSDYGCDPDSIKGRDIWIACQEQLDKFKAIFPGQDPEDFMNTFQETYPEYV